MKQQKEFPNPRKGGSKDVTDQELAFSFTQLALLTKSEDVAMQMVKVVPEVLVFNPEKNKDNFGKIQSQHQKSLTLMLTIHT